MAKSKTAQLAAANEKIEKLEKTLDGWSGDPDDAAAMDQEREELIETAAALQVEIHADAEAAKEEKEPAEPWQLKKGGTCTYCYTGPGAKRRRTNAKVLKIHKADKGKPVLIDLECPVPERPEAANPVRFEKVPPYEEPKLTHVGRPAGYCGA